MKAIQFAEYGGPEVLKVVEVEEPHATAGQIRIAVRAAGVNPIDWKLRAGYLRDFMPVSLPAGIGMDAAGIVDEVGEGVSDVAVGDAVFGSGNATYAEYAVLTSWTKKPANLSFEEAAGYPIPVETTVRILNQLPVPSGATILASGAAGGVGSALIQIARSHGLTVIGTASERNQDYLRSLGAIPTTYGEGLSERVRALAPNGIDAAFDLAGSGIIPELIEITGDPSKVLTIADYSAQQYGAQMAGMGENHAAAFAQAAQLFRDGAFQIPIERTFSLAESGEAHAISAAGHVRGRLIIIV